MSFVSFYQRTLLATFYLIILHLPILMLETHSFKPLRYTCQCSNWYKPWTSSKLGVLLVLWDLKIYVRMGILLWKKMPALILLRQIKHMAHDDFSVCSLDTKLFYHSLTTELVLMILKYYEKIIRWIIGTEGSSKNGYEFFINFAIKPLWHKKERLSKSYWIICLKSSEKFFGNWKPFENDEKCFFISSSFHSQNDSVFVLTFWSCIITAWLESKVNFKIYDVTTWLTKNYHIQIGQYLKK